MSDESEQEARQCPNCESQNWDVYDTLPTDYQDHAGIQCADCGMIGDPDRDGWFWGWP